MAFLTIDAVIQDHVCPAYPPLVVCQECPRVIARALAAVPVSYPRGVACSHNRRRSRLWAGDGPHRSPRRRLALSSARRCGVKEICDCDR